MLHQLLAQLHYLLHPLLIPLLDRLQQGGDLLLVAGQRLGVSLNLRLRQVAGLDLLLDLLNLLLHCLQLLEQLLGLGIGLPACLPTNWWCRACLALDVEGGEEEEQGGRSSAEKTTKAACPHVHTPCDVAD